MGNRSKFVAATATAGAVGLAMLRARRHARLAHAAEGIVDHHASVAVDRSPNRSQMKPTLPAISTRLPWKTTYRPFPVR